MKTIDHPKSKRKFLPNLERAEPFIQDSTIYKELGECRRRYFYRFVLGRVTPTNKYQIVLDFGSQYHKFRELLELKGYSEAMKYILSVRLPPQDPGFKFAYLNDQRLIKTCQVAYEHWKLEKSQNKIKVIAVEQPFNVEIQPGFHIGGRADQIIEFGGSLWGRDFKTTSKDKATFEKELNPNDQAIRYIYGESQIHGAPIKGIMFEGVYNLKTVGPTIFIKPVTRNPWEISQWIEEIKLNWAQLNYYRENDVWPMDTNTKKCAWCPYNIVCRQTNPESMENILRSQFKFQPWDHTKVDDNED